jgi:hypothetical protein
VGGKADSYTPPRVDGNVRDFDHRWAIDLDEVREVWKYEDVTRFFGISARELVSPNCPSPEQITQMQVGLQKGDPEVLQALQQNPQLPACLAASTPARLLDEQGRPLRTESGQPALGGAYSWGNMQTRNYDHSLHAPGGNPLREPAIINFVEEQNGRKVYIDPPGYLNVIALRNAERTEQTELRSYLRNGDILVYVHPEDGDQRIQFAAHHAAMYYDTAEGPLAFALDGSYVHHLDNPTSYGPAFNAGPSSTPFHVFRFNPNGAPNTNNRDDEGFYQFDCSEALRGPGGPEACQNGDGTFTITDEMADRYALMARNWGLINNDNAPFSGFHTLNLTSVSDLEDGFAAPALEGNPMKPTYCAALTGTNLSLGTNFPLNEAALGDLWHSFRGTSFGFDDGYFRGELAWDTLMDPYADPNYKPVFPQMRDQDLEPLPKLGTLPVKPVQASDIIANWVESYFPGFGMDESQVQQIRAGIVAQMKSRIVERFSVLDWDTDAAKLQQWREEHGAENGNGTTTDFPPVLDEQAVLGFAQAYKQGGRDSQAYRQMYRREAANVEQRYLYPPIYHVEANREGSMISYVGTVVHVDLLEPIGDNPGITEPTDGAEGFFQGGPDSSQYPHYFVPNGGSHTQRVLHVDSGPEQVGKGTTITTRISAADIHDVRVVLHPPESFEPLESLFACERDPHCLCDGDAQCMTPADSSEGKPAAVYLPLNKHVQGIDGAHDFRTDKWDDRKVSWNLFDPVLPDSQRRQQDVHSGAGCYQESGSTFCPRYDWDTGEAARDAEGHIEYMELPTARGQWTLTLLDRGKDKRAVYGEVPYCSSCEKGGAHSNQWVLQIRND